jgi:hypothetical protein
MFYSRLMTVVFCQGRSPKVVDPYKVPVPPFYPDTPIVRTDLAKHYDNIAALDKQVGNLIAQLDADELLDKTICITPGILGVMPAEHRQHRLC